MACCGGCASGKGCGSGCAGGGYASAVAAAWTGTGQFYPAPRPMPAEHADLLARYEQQIGRPDPNVAYEVSSELWNAGYKDESRRLRDAADRVRIARLTQPEIPPQVNLPRGSTLSRLPQPVAAEYFRVSNVSYPATPQEIERLMRAIAAYGQFPTEQGVLARRLRDVTPYASTGQALDTTYIDRVLGPEELQRQRRASALDYAHTIIGLARAFGLPGWGCAILPLHFIDPMRTTRWWLFEVATIPRQIERGAPIEIIGPTVPVDVVGGTFERRGVIHFIPNPVGSFGQNARTYTKIRHRYPDGSFYDGWLEESCVRAARYARLSSLDNLRLRPRPPSTGQEVEVEAPMNMPPVTPPAAPPVTFPFAARVVLSPGLNIRAAASTMAAIVATVPEERVVDVLGAVEVPCGEPAPCVWWRVRTAGVEGPGSFGFHEGFVRAVDEGGLPTLASVTPVWTAALGDTVYVPAQSVARRRAYGLNEDGYRRALIIFQVTGTSPAHVAAEAIGHVIEQQRRDYEAPLREAVIPTAVVVYAIRDNASLLDRPPGSAGDAVLVPEVTFRALGGALPAPAEAGIANNVLVVIRADGRSDAGVVGRPVGHMLADGAGAPDPRTRVRYSPPLEPLTLAWGNIARIYRDGELLLENEAAWPARPPADPAGGGGDAQLREWTGTGQSRLGDMLGSSFRLQRRRAEEARALIRAADEHSMSPAATPASRNAFARQLSALSAAIARAPLAGDHVILDELRLAIAGLFVPERTPGPPVSPSRPPLFRARVDVRVGGPGLNLRSAPSTGADLRGALDNGSIINVVATGFTEVVSEGDPDPCPRCAWWYVNDGVREGFVRVTGPGGEVNVQQVAA